MLSIDVTTDWQRHEASVWLVTAEVEGKVWEGRLGVDG